MGKIKKTFITLLVIMMLIPQSKIMADDNTVTITVNYIFSSNDAMVSQPYIAEIEKGSEFVKDVVVPSIINYSIDESISSGLSSGVTLDKKNDILHFSFSAVNSDLTINLYYVAGQAEYTVNHYFQNIEDDDYTLRESNVLTGDIDSYTKAVMSVNNKGYVCTGIPETIIAADGSTSVNIYYNRCYYTMIFDVNGGIDGPSPIYGKYGTPIIEDNINNPSRAGYDFLGWSLDVTGEASQLPTNLEENRTYYAIWSPKSDTAEYSVVVWGQNANDNEYAYIKTIVLTGKVDDLVNGNICGKIAHSHTEECNICGKQEHIHSNSCLQCGLSNHTHSISCYTILGNDNKTVELKTATLGNNLSLEVERTEGDWIIYKTLNNYRYLKYKNTLYYVKKNASNSVTIKMNCEAQEHQHIASCYCELEEHSHDSNCIGCGIEPHEHINSCYLADFIDSSLWTLDHDEPVTIDANGKSVYNVYYNRKQFTLTFTCKARGNSFTDTITARWGENILERYKAIAERANNTFWSAKSDCSSPYTNAFVIMPSKNATYYCKDASGSEGTMHYYFETLNGDYVEGFKVDGVGGYTVTKEDFYAFEGYTFNQSKSTSTGSSCKGAKFYYTRNSYTLNFFSASNGVADNSYSLKYEEPLGPYDYIPTNKPDTVEPDAIFVGWYQNPERTGSKYVVTEHNMPTHNIALYAKWVNGLYNVYTYTDESMSTPYLYSGYNGVEIDVEKYHLATAPKTPSKDGLFFVGWFYIDEQGSEQPFSFTMPITKDYHLYPKFSNNVMLTYTVHYYKMGTTEKVADDRQNTILIGTSVTEKAKFGNELNLVENYHQYYPLMTSTSKVIDGANLEFIFEYKEQTQNVYTIRFVDTEGKKLLDDVTKYTEYSIVTEQYVPIKNYTAQQFSITKELSLDTSLNVITFVYQENFSSLIINKSGVSAEDINQTFLFRVQGTSDNTERIDIFVTIHGEGSATVEHLPLGSYKVTEIIDWCWRYEIDPKQTVSVEKQLVLNGTNPFNFVNIRENKYWLDGDSYKVNVFKN